MQAEPKLLIWSLPKLEFDTKDQALSYKGILVKNLDQNYQISFNLLYIYHKHIYINKVLEQSLTQGKLMKVLQKLIVETLGSFTYI